MKKLNIFKMMLAGAIALTLASCEKEFSFDNPFGKDNTGSRTETISIQIEPMTKVTLSDNGAGSGNFAWELGDKIGVWIGTSDDDPNGGFQEFAVSEDSEDSSKKVISGEIATGNKRFNYAVYPYDANHSFSYSSADGLLFTLPSSYTLAQVSDSKTPLPMIAANVQNNGLTFYNVCGLLRLTVNDIPSGTSYLKVDFGGHQVCGDFIISSPNPGVSTISTMPSGNTDDKITITGIGEATSAVLNIPLPTGQYGSITVSAWNGSNVPLKAKVQDFEYTAKRKTGKTVSTSLTGPLTGIFKVGSKYVVISPGNLQAKTSDLGVTWTWQFAENQWDFMGNKTGSSNIKINGAGTVSSNGTVDLFAWVGKSSNWGGETEPYAAVGTSENAAMHGITNATTMGNATDYGNTIAESLKSDWGETINDGNVWRTLNKDEWTYLLSSRSGGTVNGTNKARVTYATITDLGVNGVILFPDGVTIESSEATSWGPINSDSSNPTRTQCTTAQWTALEAKGCVFLPEAGLRRYFSSKWEFVSDKSYWSSSYRGGDKTRAVAKGFDNFTGEAGIYRQRGCAVRLVHNL